MTRSDIKTFGALKIPGSSVKTQCAAKQSANVETAGNTPDQLPNISKKVIKQSGKSCLYITHNKILTYYICKEFDNTPWLFYGSVGSVGEIKLDFMYFRLFFKSDHRLTNILDR